VSCDLCKNDGGEVLWRDSFCRVVLVDDTDYPGFCRVILNEHIREMTDLDTQYRMQLMNVVFAVEQSVRSVMQPLKINLASFGNVVPHVHWHIIPRYTDDAHFPNSIWGERKREGQQRDVDIQLLRQAITESLA